MFPNRALSLSTRNKRLRLSQQQNAAFLYGAYNSGFMKFCGFIFQNLIEQFNTKKHEYDEFALIITYV